MSDRQRVVVVGAGAWGLPAAAELARRGHRVTLLDAEGVGNALASSSGQTRIWRLAHPDRLRVRLARRAVQSWQRFEARTGVQCRITVGMLWRDEEAHLRVAEAMRAEGEHVEVVAAAEVGRWFAGLRPNTFTAAWQPEAGSVLAAVALEAFLVSLADAGGEIRVGARAVAIEQQGGGVEVRLADGSAIAADRVVVAAGPWAGSLLASAGVEVPLRPVVNQVSYFGGREQESLPCLVDDPGGDARDWLYALPTPGRGLKVALEIPLRELDPDSPDRDRTPSAEIEAEVSARVARDLAGVPAVSTGSDVCVWTYGPDGQFVIDTALDGRLVYACGDSGEGFKFAAFMGELLADLAEGATPDADVAEFSLTRFGGHPPQPPGRMDLRR